jgi:hypothetical protein
MTRVSLIRIFAATIAVAGLALVVLSVNTHGDRATLGVFAALRAQSQALVQARARERARENQWMAGGGLELVDMFQCMCAGPLGTDIRGWVGLWIVTVVLGGVPTAVLLRNRT